MNRSRAIILSREEQSKLDSWARGRRVSLRLVLRAHIIQMAAKGVLNHKIAEALNISRPTVQLWRDRFLALRLAGLEKDAPRPGDSRIPRPK
jgi:FixJ family two-component response regulator